MEVEWRCSLAIAAIARQVVLQELHDPQTGRLDAARIADYLKIPLKQLAGAVGQPFLRSIKRVLEILEQVFATRPSALAWLNSPHPDLGQRAPLDVILEGYP